MSSETYRVVATHYHDTKPDVYTVSSESFATMEEAVAWMNGGSGENFSAACTIDTNGCDEQLVDYWLDEVEVWPQSQIDALPEKPGVQVPIDEPEPEGHTYMTHLQFSARDDEHARRISAQIVHVITEWQASIDADEDEPLMLLAQGYAIEAAHVTDADDWAEHVGAEDVCRVCGAGGTNRLRTGSGARVCPGHLSPRYRIEDVRI